MSKPTQDSKYFGLTKKQVLLLVVLAVLNFAVICGLGSIVWSGYKQSQLAVVPQTISTVQPSPTPTIQPTATQKPTHTPTPTLTPIPQPVATENDILNEICDERTQFEEFYQSNGVIRIYLVFAKLDCEHGHGDLLLWVAAQNITQEKVHVNPLYFSTIDFQGRVHNVDSKTFGETHGFEATDLLYNTHTDGFLFFGVGRNNAPHYIVYDDGWNPAIRIDLTEVIRP
ncbi:MAG: hypothetical protein DRP09_19450 [Candidatus Thorarchaeota archaeon]|nr:MAG: hypothetical protein DRP09_19450 [Candidatus Thorarchaeota archaeon]